MSDAQGRRRTPIRSLRGETPEATDVARWELYLAELERQAKIVNDGIARAWIRAMRPVVSPEDSQVWSDLQAALFAAIIVERVIKPTAGVQWRYDGHESRTESQNYAQQRGEKLRALLDISDTDAALFAVSRVRNPLEHIDERLDRLIVANATSVSDWYISDGLATVTPPPETRSPGESHGFGLRVFHPAGGTLRFDTDVIDLFAIDFAMLALRHQAIPDARDELGKHRRGRYEFGSLQLVELLSAEKTTARQASWLKARSDIGEPVEFAEQSDPAPR